MLAKWNWPLLIRQCHLLMHLLNFFLAISKRLPTFFYIKYSSSFSGNVLAKWNWGPPERQCHLLMHLLNFFLAILKRFFYIKYSSSFSERGNVLAKWKGGPPERQCHLLSGGSWCTFSSFSLQHVLQPLYDLLPLHLSRCQLTCWTNHTTANNCTATIFSSK